MLWCVRKNHSGLAFADDFKMDADLIELLTQNLTRLDESVETDRAGIYYALSEYRHMHRLSDTYHFQAFWRICPLRQPLQRRLARTPRSYPGSYLAYNRKNRQ